MPRYLDAAERERTVIAAAWRVIARDGIASLTVRNVAAEAGLAPSSLRYTFPTQATVREQALRTVSRRIGERVRALPGDLTGAGRARAILLELLPLDDERHLEMEVFLALGMAALTDAELRPLWIESAAVVRQFCAEAIELIAEDPDPAQVDHVHALIDGLALHLLVADNADDPEWAYRVIDAHLASTT